jgi:hypothetical protein
MPCRLVRLCLSGFATAASLTARLGMAGLRDVFVNALCNFSHLHAPATMRFKHALAFKYLLTVAAEVGDHLEDRCAAPCYMPCLCLQQHAIGCQHLECVLVACHCRLLHNTRTHCRSCCSRLAKPMPTNFYILWYCHVRSMHVAGCAATSSAGRAALHQPLTAAAGWRDWTAELATVSCSAPVLVGRWLDVLRCISRWELLQQVASGTPSDALLFAMPAKEVRDA